MNMDLITRVFRELDKELKEWMSTEEYEEHVIDRANNFWAILERVNHNSLYAEFMEK